MSQNIDLNILFNLSDKISTESRNTLVDRIFSSLNLDSLSEEKKRLNKDKISKEEEKLKEILKNPLAGVFALLGVLLYSV